MPNEREPRLGPLLRPGSLVDQVRGFARFSFALFLLVAVALSTLLLLDVHRYGPHVRESVEANRLLRLGHEAMLEQETSLRAFLLSGDSSFLVPYQEARAALAELTESADARLGTGATAGAYLELRLARQAWIEGWTGAAMSEARRAEDPDARERRTELLIEGRELFDAYHERYDVLSAQAIQVREDALDAQTDAIARVAGGTLVCTIMLGSFAAWRVRRLRLAVTGPVASILDHLSSIRSGDLTQERTDYIGLTELKIIDDGLTATARSLASAQAEASERAEELRAQNEQLAEVLRFAREVAGSLNLRYVLRGLCTATSAISGGRRVIVWLRPPDVAQVEAVADTDGPQLAPVGLAPIPLGEGPVGHAAQRGRIEGRGAGVLDQGTDVHAVCIPMVVGAQVVGVIEVCADDRGAIPIETLNILEALAVQAASAVSAARLHEHTEGLAMSDALTRLPNRRRLEIDLATEAAVSTRHGRPLGFAMIDVDHFKAYNDSEGHQSADVALQQLADVLVATGREGDTVYRYGGEEIAVVLRETDCDGAFERAERMREAIEHHFSAPGQPRPVTVSIGVAAMPKDASTPHELVAAADAALYVSKRGGRNRTSRAAPG